MLVPVRIKGIPALARIDYYDQVKPNSAADSDWDYTGYTELEYTVCDRRGRPAPWLDRKNDDTVEAQVISYFEERER